MYANHFYNQSDKMTLVDVLRYWAKHSPDRTALVFLADGDEESKRLTFAELDEMARDIATRLLALHATGKCAVMLYTPGLEFITAFWGCLYAGVIGIPVYPPKHNRNQIRLSNIIKDVNAAFALSTRTEIDRWGISNAPSEELASCAWLATDDLPFADTEYIQPEISPESIAFLQYSSGSTGIPKGVMVSQGNLVHNLEYMRQIFDFRDDSISVSWLPFFHDMGLILGMLEPIYSGILSVLMPPAAFAQRPLRWLQAISHYRATHSGAPNFAYDLCVKRITEEDRKQLDLSTWCNAYNAAEPVRKSTLVEFTKTFASCGFSKKAFYPTYGLAEFTLIISGGSNTEEPIYLDLNAQELEKNHIVPAHTQENDVQSVVSCGRVSADIRLEIVDPDKLTLVEPGQIGEIWVSSRSVAQGYWKKAEATQKTFHACIAGSDAPHFLRTGDLGFIHNGELYIAGRQKDLIIIRGRNLYPQDLEFTAEQSHPALRSGFGAAFPITVNHEEKIVIAYELERTALRTVNTQQVISAVRSAVLDEYEVHAYDVVLLRTGTVPKTSSGKIQRLACKQSYLEHKFEIVDQFLQTTEAVNSTSSQQENKDDLVQRIFSIVTEFVFQTHNHQVTPTLTTRINADLGLDSLDVTVLLAKLEKETGIVIDMTKVTNLATLDDLIHMLRLNRANHAIVDLTRTMENLANEGRRLQAVN